MKQITKILKTIHKIIGSRIAINITAVVGFILIMINIFADAEIWDKLEDLAFAIFALTVVCSLTIEISKNEKLEKIIEDNNLELE